MNNVKSCTRDEKVQGRVSYVNQDLLYFTIGKFHNVNVGYLLSHKAMLELPHIGDKVIVANTHYGGACVSYACERSTFNIAERLSNVPNVQRDCLMKRLISEWRLGVADLADTYAMYVKLQSCYKSTDQIIAEITLNLLKLILECRYSVASFSDQCCLNKILPFFHLKSVYDCKFVDIQGAEYKKFPYWSFGVHPSMKSDFLVGYLYVHPDYGTFMLEDAHYRIVCLIVNPTYALRQIADSFVLISKFYVVTELYGTSAIGNSDCIIVDFNNIKLLKHNGNVVTKNFVDCGTEMTNNLQHYIIFKLENVSVTLISMDSPTRWLQLSVIDCDLSLGKNILLCVRKNFMKIVPFLIEGYCYKLQFNGPLEKIFDTEFKRIYPHHLQFNFIHDNFILNVEDKSEPARQFMSVGQCKQYIARCPNELVSFRGKIKAKRFADPLSSRTAKQTNIFAFGTPGPKTHYIEFAVEGDNVKTLSVYLNNWETILMPFGLIPDVVMCVRNVSHQKGKYCKATRMTSFEIVGYEPDIEYTTVNLFTGHGDDWGPPFYLSLGHRIPYGVLVWCKIQSLWVRSLKISTTCLSCSQKVSGQCECNNGDVSAVTLHTMMTLLVQDTFGTAKIVSGSTELLRILLNLQPHEWEVWTSAFQHIGTFEFNTESTIRTPKNVLFNKVLTNAVNVINSIGCVNLDLCCRKMNSNNDTHTTDPVWYCIRARKT